MKAFIQTSILVNLGLYALGHLIPAFSEFAATWAWAMLVVGYAVLTLLLFGWIVRAATKSPMQFVTAVNGATAAKMLTSLAIVTYYLVAVGGVHRIPFALGLFGAFAANTFLLVASSQKISHG
jgi:hypothetical protein